MISKVKSNVKGGVEATLSQRTLVVGKNASGKSAIVQSVELAVSGAASDVAGRALLKAPAELQMLTPPGAESLWAEVVGDRFAARFEAAQGHLPKRTGPEVAIPLREVRAALLGSAETARKALLGWAGVVEGWAERAKASLPPVLHALFGAAVQGDLATTIDAAKGKARQSKAVAGSEEENARRISSTVPTLLTPEGLKALEMRHEIALQAEQARTYEGMRAFRVEAGLRMEGVVRRLEEAVSRVNAAERDLAALPAAPDIPVIFKVALDVIDHLASTKATGCPICGGEAPSPTTFAERAAKAHGKIDAAMTLIGHRRTMEATLSDASADYAAAKADHGRLSTEIARLDSLLATAPAMPDLVPEETPSELEAKLFQARQAARTFEEAKAARARALEGERTAREWGDLADALSKHLAAEVEQARALFEGRVQKFLPTGAGWRFGVDLLDGEREVLRVGLRDAQGKVRAALSGAEWATVTAALALAVANGRECIVVPEERAFDPETLGTVLESLGRAAEPAQVIVTSPVMPARLPQGWHVVVTDAPKPVAAPEPAAETKKVKGKAKKAEPAASAAPAQATSPNGNVCPHGCGEVVLGTCEHGIGPGKPVRASNPFTD